MVILISEGTAGRQSLLLVLRHAKTQNARQRVQSFPSVAALGGDLHGAALPHQREEPQKALAVDTVTVPGDGYLAGKAAGRLDESGGHVVQLLFGNRDFSRAFHVPTPFHEIIGVSIARFYFHANFY